jgi:hypothetical protein
VCLRNQPTYLVLKGEAALIMEVIYKCESKEERVQTKEEVNRGILIGYVEEEAILLRELSIYGLLSIIERKREATGKLAISGMLFSSAGK